MVGQQFRPFLRFPPIRQVSFFRTRPRPTFFQSRVPRVYPESLRIYAPFLHRSIRPAENKWVAFTAMGEGWHNYHHAFPWDYKAAELGNYRLNPTTMFIDAFAKIGWATDLKTAPEALIEKVVLNRGDGTGRSRFAKALQ